MFVAHSAVNVSHFCLIPIRQGFQNRFVFNRLVEARPVDRSAVLRCFLLLPWRCFFGAALHMPIFPIRMTR